MRKLAAVLVAVVLGLFAGAEMAYAQADGVQRVADADWHSGAYDSEKGTNFADPNGYKRMVQVQGAGDAGSGDAGSGDAGAAGSTGGDGGNGPGAGDGCSK